MLINCHTHTFRSHDSAAQPFALCESALRSGLDGLTFTDHCDCEFFDSADIIGQFEACSKDFNAAKEAYGNRLRLYFGIELGDPLYAPPFAQKILQAFHFDAVLLSVHAVRFPGFGIPFSKIDFSAADDAFLSAYLRRYFTDLLESIQTFDFDILCHLTVPLRYIMLKYQKQVDLSPFYPVIDQILLETVRREKTLEINTSALSLPGGFLMPDEYIIYEYLRLGGSLFCIGSDAHTPDAVALGLTQTAEYLFNKGIKELCLYKDRQRYGYSIAP